MKENEADILPLRWKWFPWLRVEGEWGGWTREPRRREHTHKCRPSTLRPLCFFLCKYVSLAASTSPVAPGQREVPGGWGNRSIQLILRPLCQDIHKPSSCGTTQPLRGLMVGGAQEAPAPAVGGHKQNELRTPLGQKFLHIEQSEQVCFIWTRCTSLI